MEELARYGRCLEASSNPGADSDGPSSFQEFLKDLQELRRNVALLTMEAKERLTQTRVTRDRLREEVPHALSLVLPNQLGEFYSLSQPSGPKTPVKIKTPLSGRKKLSRDAVALARKLLDREAVRKSTPKSPKVRTPISTRKLALSRSLHCNTPLSSVKKNHLSALKLKLAPSPNSTPQMPKFMRQSKLRSARKSETKVLIGPLGGPTPRADSRNVQRTAEKSTRLDPGTPEAPGTRHGLGSMRREGSACRFVSKGRSEPDAPESAHRVASTLPSKQFDADKSTPEMMNRIVFFDNPNIENIHQRYVAIQDSEELTCLLPKMIQSNQNGTPERPQTQKIHVRSTPPLPLVFDPTPKKSLTPDMPIVRKTPGTLVSTAGKSANRGTTRRSRTPSPPRFAPRAARLCLASKLNGLPSGQDERDRAALSTRHDVHTKVPTKSITPEAPSRRVTFKSSKVNHNNTVNSSETSNSAEVVAALKGCTISTNKSLLISTKKTPELNEFRRTLTKPFLDEKVAKEAYPDVVNNLESVVKVSQQKTPQEATQIQQGSLRRRVLLPNIGSANKRHINMTVKTPLKSAKNNRTPFKTPAKTPSKQVPSVSLGTNEKSRPIRPSKMQRLQNH